MLLFALVLKIIAAARGVCIIGTIIFLIMRKRLLINKFAFATSCLFIVEFLLGLLGNFTWWPFILAILFAIIHIRAKEKN